MFLIGRSQRDTDSANNGRRREETSGTLNCSLLFIHIIHLPCTHHRQVCFLCSPVPLYYSVLVVKMLKVVHVQLLRSFPYLGSERQVFVLEVLKSCASSLCTCISFTSFPITSLHLSFGLPILQCSLSSSCSGICHYHKCYIPIYVIDTNVSPTNNLYWSICILCV